MDAYTLRKIAPRILVGVIGINLSIYLCIFAIDLTEIVAKGLHQLLISPFDEAALQNELPAGMTTGTVGAGAAAALGLLAGTIYVSLVGASSVFMIIGILMLLGIVIFVVLALRSALLVLLTIISPVALALFILPGTEKYFRQWWDLFLRALMVYPIIAAMFAVSEVLVMVNIDGAAAARDSGASEGAGLVRILLTLFLAFAPLFLIPFAFRFAGGALSTIMNSAGSPIKRMSAARQKFTSGQIAKNRQALKEGRRWGGSIPGTQRLSNRANIIGRGASSGLRGHFGVGQRGRGAHYAGIEQGAQNAMREPGWAAVKENDDALRAGTYDSREDAMRGLRRYFMSGEGGGMAATDAEDRARSAVHAWKGAGYNFGDHAAQHAAVQAMTQTGTAHSSIPDMTQTISRVARGNANSGAALAGHANAVSKQVGRHDLAPGFGRLNDLVQGDMGTPGVGSRGQPLTPPTPALYAQARTSAWNSASLYQHANDKPQNIEAAVEHFSAELTSGDADRMQEAAVFFHELEESMLPNSSGAVQDEINSALANNEVALENYYNSFSDTTVVGDEAVMGDITEAHPAAGTPGGPAAGTTVTRRGEVSRRNITEREQQRRTIREISRTYQRPDPNNM